MQAATDLFLERGFDATTMDHIATRAQVSKPTLYRYFRDKEGLYAAIVQATTDDVSSMMGLVAKELDVSRPLHEGLRGLALRLLSILTQPELLRLRRLVIAQAERFPEIGRNWFAQGFGRVLATLAAAFEGHAAEGRLVFSDAHMAAEHFVGLVLWIPLNNAMFSGEVNFKPSELQRYANGAVEAFLNGYVARK